MLRQKETQDNKKKRARAASDVSIVTALKLTRACIDAVFMSAGIYQERKSGFCFVVKQWEQFVQSIPDLLEDLVLNVGTF